MLAPKKLILRYLSKYVQVSQEENYKTFLKEIKDLVKKHNRVHGKEYSHF